jgi:PHD/YefM family antitoxin component YafN of YafNO toxin-antitoxin module
MKGKSEVIIEQDGRPVAVVMSYERYEALLEELADLRDGPFAAAELAAWRADPTTGQEWEAFLAEVEVSEE